MSINFIPNDPTAGPTAPAMHVQAPRPNRPASRSDFTFTGATAEGPFAPETPQFLFWQCREAALATLEAWEASAGNHTRWQGNRRKLALRQDAGDDLNAFYDRSSFSFFHKTVGGKTFSSGASTDVVAHELGHGLLDALRPDLWDVTMLEAGAYHEAFGDCVAILTALADLGSRQKLLAVTPDLRKRNFIESTAENLSEGIGKFIPGHNATEPRHGFNTFKFQLPTSLPDDGGPGELINEVHSFGMLFSGCFWDLIANLFGAAAAKTEATLLSAAQLAGTLLAESAKTAVVTPRFLQSVGRAMVVADQSLHGGANVEHIRNAFHGHDILLGTNAMMAPSIALAGGAPGRATLAAATRRDLAKRLDGGRSAKLTVSASNLLSGVVEAVQTREVPLGSVDSSLKGVVAIAQEPVMVGASGGRASVMGVLPHREDTDTEVHSFVRSLLEHDRIDTGKRAKGVRKSAVAPAAAVGGATHAVRKVGEKKVLRRIRFQCCCRGCC
jgi:fungalysin metallopeptidase (M36)